MAKRSWYSYFKENMDNFPLGGLPCPESLFSSLAQATSAVATISLALAGAGKKGVTFAELLAAGTTAEAGPVIGQLAARAGTVVVSFYVGYALGSMGVATAAYIRGSDAHYEADPPPDDTVAKCLTTPRDPNARPGTCANPG